MHSEGRTWGGHRGQVPRQDLQTPFTVTVKVSPFIPSPAEVTSSPGPRDEVFLSLTGCFWELSPMHQPGPG